MLQSERMFREPAEALDEVLEFLELDRWAPDHFGNRYSGGYRATMAPATRQQLVGYFAPHNERLFELLGTRYDWT